MLILMTGLTAGMSVLAEAILPGLPGAAPESDAAAEIRAARASFNRAIAEADIKAIRYVLAEQAVLVTGTDSAVLSGRKAQLDVWKQDFADPARLVYVRTPADITLSATDPIGMEIGEWRGTAAGNDQDWVGGVYSAKWRKIDGRWQIEAETYMTASCGGRFCDE